MTTAPILTAEDVLVTAIKAALAPSVGTYNGRPKAYYQQAEQSAPLPFIIFQLQSDVQRLDYVDETGAEVLVTVKALASSGSAARTLVNTAAPALESMTATGFTITARYQRSPTIPPSGGVYQALHVYRVRIERT